MEPRRAPLYGISPPRGRADGGDVHVAFTSACNLFQHWQTEVVLNSALRAGFRGPITRIVVGCESKVGGRQDATTHAAGILDDIVGQKEWRRSTFPNVTLHLAPHPPSKKKFPWMNKAWGFYHWSVHGEVLADVVAVIDPDQFFLSPLTQNVDPRTSWQLAAAWQRDRAMATDAAQPGLAIAQEYGIGDVFVRRFNRTAICGAGSACTMVTSKDALKHYSIGVPYMIHRSDFRQAMTTWWAFMPETYRQDPGDLQARATWRGDGPGGNPALQLARCLTGPPALLAKLLV
jgi:hypothetical protein